MSLMHVSLTCHFQLLKNKFKTSALVTGDAVLNFANRVSEATKRYFVRETDAWKIEQCNRYLEQVAREAAAPVTAKN